MKKLLNIVFALALVLSSGRTVLAAFPPDELKVLDKKEITALTDDQLTDHYVDALVELEAVKTFHATSGFTPTEYNSYKNLLKYRLLLLMEIHKRNLALPPSVE